MTAMQDIEEYVKYLRNKHHEKQHALQGLQKENEEKLEVYLKEKRATYQEKEKTLLDLRGKFGRLEDSIASLKDNLRQLQPVNVQLCFHHFVEC